MFVSSYSEGVLVMSNLNVCVCGCGRSASEVCGTTEYVINFGWVKKNDSYSPPEEVKDVCEIAGCTLIPQAGETICSACWNKHDSYNTPGFPEGFDDISEEGQAFADKADQYEVNKCSGDQESYDWREAE